MKPTTDKELGDGQDNKPPVVSSLIDGTENILARGNNDGDGELISPSRSQKKNEFEGQVAIITGAASGIGLAISLKLLDEGATVVLFDINGPGLNAEFKKYKKKADAQTTFREITYITKNRL